MSPAIRCGCLSVLLSLLVAGCAPSESRALVRIDGLEDPVGPGSTIGTAAVVNALKCLVAEQLTQRGQPPLVLTSSFFIDPADSRRKFDASYDEYRRRLGKLFQ